MVRTVLLPTTLPRRRGWTPLPPGSSRGTQATRGAQATRDTRAPRPRERPCSAWTHVDHLDLDLDLDGAVPQGRRNVRRRRRAASRRGRPLTRPPPCPDEFVHSFDGERPSGCRASSSGPRSPVVDPDPPSAPVPRTVHTFPHCGALFCGYRHQRVTDSSYRPCEPHSYTACGWSCPQSSTGFLWVFTSAERGHWWPTTGGHVSRQILTRSGSSPRNLWTGQFVHTLWTASPHPVCAQFCGQLWMTALSVWTGHPRSVDDVWGQIVRPQGLRLSHTGRTGSSTRISAR